jgi:hypothetical protein
MQIEQLAIHAAILKLDRVGADQIGRALDLGLQIVSASISCASSADGIFDRGESGTIVTSSGPSPAVASVLNK